LVKVSDYFSKIDNKKICKLKIILRKMIENVNFNEKIGMPEEISQYMINHGLYPVANNQLPVSNPSENAGNRRNSLLNSNFVSFDQFQNNAPNGNTSNIATNNNK
jgi:hypothetical protein